MPNLVYYKDSSGVVRGPISEEEALDLHKANFFKESHSFKLIDSDDFQSFNDLVTLNGAETPFKNVLSSNEKEEHKELVRVYKELSTVLQERNKLTELTRVQGSIAAVRSKMIEEFTKTMQMKNIFEFRREGSEDKFTTVGNNSKITLRVHHGNSWDPTKALEWYPGRNAFIPGFAGGKYVFIAPFLSSDPMNGSDLVHMFNFFYKDKEGTRNLIHFP